MRTGNRQNALIARVPIAGNVYTPDYPVPLIQCRSSPSSRRLVAPSALVIRDLPVLAANHQRSPVDIGRWILCRAWISVAALPLTLAGIAPNHCSGQSPAPAGSLGSIQDPVNPGRNSVPPNGEITDTQEAQGLPHTGEQPFDSEFAYAVLNQICQLGPRVSGSSGMLEQRKFLTGHLRANGAEVFEHPFSVASPFDGRPTQLVNLFGRWHPERKLRILLCCHFDTRPFADRDPTSPQAVFLGANDGASGVGLLAELARHLSGLEGRFGVDLCFFDGEEFVYVAQRDPMFLGSTAFANAYAAGQWDVKYSYAILVDMIGDRELQIYFEGNSLKMAPRLTKSIWSVAKDMGVSEFIPKKNHEIRDDHLPLNTIARIETCDIIDFDYPNENSKNAYWHTTRDVPENCSAESLQKVGSVLLEWIRQLQDPKR